MSHKNFISAVSSYNKELFHSKAITWLLNQFPEFQKAFLKSILDKEDYIKSTFIEALSEIRQIDILVVYKLDDKYKFIHIENKIKASESFKKTKENETGSKEKILSQTEYYFLRLNNKKFRKDLAQEINNKIKNTIEPHDISELDLKTDPECYWNFIFLKPSHSLKNKIRMNSLNSWREDIWEAGEVINPWVTKSYKELVIDSLAAVEEGIVPANTPTLRESEKEYASLLKDDFTSSEKYLEHENFLSLENVDKAVKNKMNVIEKSTLGEWFKYLEKKLNENFTKSKLEIKDSPLDILGFEAKFITETGNNGGFLIQAFYLISDFKFTKNIGKNLSTARIGLQYEHNSTSAKMKFFFAANNYDKVKIYDKKNRELYNKKVKSFLSIYNFKAISNSKLWSDKFNGSKGKTFCSRAVEIKDIKTYENFKDLHDMFEEYIKLLFEDLNKINDKVWREFSQS